MPALSVVVVVHGEQAYIEECVASVLGQPFTEVELIAVDDASPDHGPELLDTLAAADDRLQVLHLPERAGPAAARAAGLERARGEHVWFIRTTDRLAPGSLASVSARLEATAPDVLIVHHTLTAGTKAAKPGPHARLLAKLAADPGPLQSYPGVAATARNGWDKVVRRELLAGLGQPLAPDPALGWPALLVADRLDGHPEVAYERRTPANAEREPGGQIARLDAYDAVLTFAEQDARVPDGRRRLILPALLADAQGALGRVPRRDRATYFARLSEIARRHARGDEPRPSGRIGRLRRRLIERGDLRAYDLLETARRHARRVRRAPRSRAARLRKSLRARALQRHYARARRRPIDPDLAVFAAYWYRGYSCNPRAIYERARELVPGMRGVWVVTRDAVDALPADVEHVVSGTREYYDLLATARYFVNNVNFPNHLVKRDGTVHVMTHHGTPLKRMGMDLRDTPIAGQRMNFDALMRRCARWDFSVSSNPLSTLVWERVYPTRHETVEAGYPRNDVLVTTGDEAVRRIRAGLGIAEGRTAVLYAPTHREWRSGYVPTMDVGAVAEALGPDFVLLARLHYFYGEDPLLRELHAAGRILDVASHRSVEELCLAADVLVTDYSSLMFDYAVLDRPIVIHAPDWEVYRAMRGTYFDLMQEPPGVIARTDDEVVTALRSGAAAGEAAARDRAAFRARFCPWDDGGAAERVVRRVWLGERVSAPVAPVVTR